MPIDSSHLEIHFPTGWLPTSVGNSVRSSSSTAFLHPALDSRHNPDLLINTHVTRLTRTSPPATTFTGVQVSQKSGGPTSSFTARKEVILSAGVIGTPQILMLSGIGPTQTLKKASITPIVDVPDVGRNLQDQAIFFLKWAANFDTLDSFINNPAAIGTALTQYEANKTGIAASSVIFNTLGFMRLLATSMLLKHGDPAAGPNSAHFQYSFVLRSLVIETSPTSGNWISVSVLVQFPTSTPFKGKLRPPAVNLTSDAQIEAYIRSGATTVKHPVASAKISKTTDQGWVVGPDLTVKKVKGVRVVDASIFPFAVTGFLQAEIYIVAERAAALIKDKWSLKA
ncbi:hypothetical protein B0H19DRAFT_1276369 [Mycena capillaripes]|nr:hypothetical protein B0H19DRAFT_1276369 [Mycena capillaripes]